MPTLHTYDYAVIRVVPRVEREEFINVGVIVSCPSAGHLQAAIEIDATPAVLAPLIEATDLLTVLTEDALRVLDEGAQQHGLERCAVGNGRRTHSGIHRDKSSIMNDCSPIE